MQGHYQLPLPVFITPFAVQAEQKGIHLTLRGLSMSSDDDIVPDLAAGCVLGLIIGVIGLVVQLLRIRIVFVILMLCTLVAVVLVFFPAKIPSIPIPSIFGTTYIINTNGSNGRECPNRTCKSVASFNVGNEITVFYTVEGENINNNNSWLVIWQNNSRVYIHSSVASPKTTTPPIEPVKPSIYIIKGSNTRARVCPRLDCQIARKFNKGEEIQVSGEEKGDVFEDSNVWLRVVYTNPSTVYVHSSLAFPKTTPETVERIAPYDFSTELNGLVSCNFTNVNGTGEAKIESDINNGHLLVDLRARSLSGKAEGRAAIGVKYIAPINGRVKIDADVLVTGVDSLSMIDVPELGETAITSVDSSVEIYVKRIHNARDDIHSDSFAKRIMSPSLLPIPSSPVDLVTYIPPKTFSGSIEIDVLEKDQLYICVGIKSKVVATGLVPFGATAKVLYGKSNDYETKVERVRISYK